jgi:hypothetical protein
MTIKKLLINYQQITKKAVLDWKEEFQKFTLMGDEYFSEGYNKLNRFLRIVYPGRKEDDAKDEYVRHAKIAFENHTDLVNQTVQSLSTILSLSQIEPVRLEKEKHLWHMSDYLKAGSENIWLYQDALYSIDGQYTDGQYTDDERKLLILEYADGERKKFERLKTKFSSKNVDELKYERIRIPEEVRVEVWRRDQGRCVRCGSRENLEYDHIVPISKGGSNTARNIELLCQNCNRTKSNHIQ